MQAVVVYPDSCLCYFPPRRSMETRGQQARGVRTHGSWKYRARTSGVERHDKGVRGAHGDLLCNIHSTVNKRTVFSTRVLHCGSWFPTSPRSASHDSVYVSPLVTGLPLKKEKTEVCFNVPLISRIKWQPDFQFFKLTIILSSFYKINKRSHSKMLFVNRERHDSHGSCQNLGTGTAQTTWYCLKPGILRLFYVYRCVLLSYMSLIIVTCLSL